MEIGNQGTINNHAACYEVKELTARNIFNRIMKGEVVRIPNDPTAASQLKNHLNVIKSREKKLFLSLGLDFITSVINLELQPASVNEETKTITLPFFEVKLVPQKQRRKFSAFVISKQEDVASSSV